MQTYIAPKFDQLVNVYRLVSRSILPFQIIRFLTSEQETCTPERADSTLRVTLPYERGDNNVEGVRVWMCAGVTPQHSYVVGFSLLPASLHKLLSFVKKGYAYYTASSFWGLHLHKRPRLFRLGSGTIFILTVSIETEKKLKKVCWKNELKQQAHNAQRKFQ